MAGRLKPLLTGLYDLQTAANSAPSPQHTPLSDSGPACIHPSMKQNFDMDDRARLRERFYGVTMTVLARL